MLVSEHPGIDIGRQGCDPWAADSWLAARDPPGDLRRQLEANGAFADGECDVGDVQQLLFSILETQGNLVSLDVMPDSNHEYLAGGAGLTRRSARPATRTRVARSAQEAIRTLSSWPPSRRRRRATVRRDDRRPHGSRPSAPARASQCPARRGRQAGGAFNLAHRRISVVAQA